MSDFPDFDGDFPFSGEDDDNELPLEDNEFPGLEDEDEGFPNLPEEDEEKRGNRTFVLLAVVMVILFVIGLLAVLFLATRNNGPSEPEMTAFAVETFNAQQVVYLGQTQTAAVEFGMTGTFIAQNPSETPTPTITIPPTVTPTPTIDSTVQAATQSVEMTMTALAITQTVGAMSQSQQETLIAAFTQTAAAFQTANPVTPTVGAPATLSLDNVNATATALVGFFQTATAEALGLGQGGGENGTPGAGASPTSESFGPAPTAMPNTGIFDDIATGSGGGVGVLALAAFGLVGVIFVSRRLRSHNDK